MKKMAAGSFKTKCLAIMDEVQAKHETVVITKHGKPVAKLVRLDDQSKRRVLGSAKGEFRVPDDFNDPLPKDIEDLFWE